jgi:hypothetical protein
MKNKLLLIAMGIGLTTQMIIAQVPSYVPTNGLVGYWSFNGNSNDQSGIGNNGTVTGAVLTSDRFGNVNSAYSFNGLNNYIELGNISGLSQTNGVSMSAWILWNGANGVDNHQYIFQIAPNPNGAITIADTGSLGINVANCNCVNDIGVNTTINQNTWYHVVLTYDLLIGTMKMYLNGNLIGTSQENMYNYYSVNNSNSRFGNYYFNSHYFKGTIDEGILWNRALTQDEVTGLYYADNSCQSLVINTGVLSFNPPTYSNTVTIYPNPANDHITIDCGNLANVSGWTIKIVNTLGQEVFSGAMNTQQYVVPLNSWSGQGVYFVKIYDASNNLMNTKKIILQ